MSIASEITALTTNLSNAKNAVTAKGGTVGDTGLAGLATEIATIPSGSLTTYATLKYVDGSQVEHTLSVNAEEFELLTIGEASTDRVTIDSTTITFSQITEIEVADGVTFIPDNFMSWCANLTTIVLPTSIVYIGSAFCYQTALNCELELTNVEYIGSSFLFSNFTFNYPINLPNIEVIGLGFLRGCSSFNSAVTLGNKIINIDDYFLYQCTLFNNSISLGSVHRIGNYFLSGCTSFSQSLTLPSTLTNTAGKKGIGTNFMYNAKNFIGPLVCNAPVTVTSNHSGDLTTNDATALMYTTGVTLTGTYAQEWKDNYPDKNTSPYRKLIVGS